VLADVDEMYVAKGKRVVHVDLRSGRPPRNDLLELLLGPTGNLRAPTLRRGRTLLVGFEEATYKKVLSASLRRRRPASEGRAAAVSQRWAFGSSRRDGKAAASLSQSCRTVGMAWTL